MAACGNLAPFCTPILARALGVLGRYRPPGCLSAWILAALSPVRLLERLVVLERLDWRYRPSGCLSAWILAALSPVGLLERLDSWGAIARQAA